MAGTGGYMKPNQPAAVSGPGKFSQRTDGGPGETMKQAARYIQGDQYGDSQEINQVAQAAPLAAGPKPPAARPTPISAPTQRPDEPVTAGAPVGPGPGPEILNLPKRTNPALEVVREAYRQYPSAHLRVMLQKLEQENR